MVGWYIGYGDGALWYRFVGGYCSSLMVVVGYSNVVRSGDRRICKKTGLRTYVSTR